MVERQRGLEAVGITLDDVENTVPAAAGVDERGAMESREMARSANFAARTGGDQPGSTKGDLIDFGYFAMPSHPPERDLREGYEWDLQTIRWADEFGYGDFWVGEHHTAPWEPHPAPDYLVLEGFRNTERLRIGPGGFLLP